jgi:hypothetical protein
VGGKAFNSWERIPFGYLEERRRLIPARLRPSAKNLELTGRIIAQNMPELHNGTVFGDCDETHDQISLRAHGFLSIGEVKASLRVLDGDIFLITRKPAKGRNGTHRTFHPDLDSKIATWERGGAQPTPQEVALWDARLYGHGCKPQRFGIERQRSGVNPTPPIEGPITSTYKRPRSQGNSAIVNATAHDYSIEQLCSELAYLDDAQRNTSNPRAAQQARLRYVQVLADLRRLGVNHPWELGQ